ncbi:hypothetical protein GAYE_SCF51G6070 [Galdieria yellowstonensis]|uniref:Uncharacterized protein n=1 Tax=Galdieria yellowstonensis TaxID=3028027 RepID=A0AAV9ILV4_9RHOD|nr:hypothetical protein GAYE_SCF51G6070 [Galdieria yellowstonensis]
MLSSRWCWDSSCMFSKLGYKTSKGNCSNLLATFLRPVHSRSTHAPVNSSLEVDNKSQDHLEGREPCTTNQHFSKTVWQQTNGKSNLESIHSDMASFNGADPTNHATTEKLSSENGFHLSSNNGSSDGSNVYQGAGAKAHSYTNGEHRSETWYSLPNTTTCTNSHHNHIAISLTTSHSSSSQSVLSALKNKFGGQQKTDSSDLAKFVAHESGKYYDFAKSYRHIRQENAYVHAFLKTRMDCPNTSVILPQTVGSDRVFRLKERNAVNLLKTVVNNENSFVSNQSNANNAGTTSGNNSNNNSNGSCNGTSGGRKRNPPARLITQRILEEGAEQKEKVQKEFEEKVRDVLKRKGKFSLDDETAKQLVKEYSCKKFASSGQTATTSSKASSKEENTKETEEEEQLYPKEIPKNKKEEEVSFQDELGARLRQLEKKPNFTNLVDISQIVKVFPQDHWSAEQVNRLALFAQQIHGLSATTRVERLTKFIHQLNEEVRKSQEEQPMSETKRTRGRKPFQGVDVKKETSAKRKQARKK